jgi:hypothetical protein
MNGTLETVWLLGAALLTAGCLPAYSGDATNAEAASEMDETAIEASVANGAYRYSPQFAPLNRDAYASAAAPTAKINVWVSASQVTAYAKVDPGKVGTGVKLQPGAMIVREVLAADGSVAKLTLMVKGPPGYNSQLGDYWFAVTEPDGTPIIEKGAKLTGKLTQCFSCHIPRANDDYLFGVPAAARTPSGGTAPLSIPDMATALATPDMTWVPPPQPHPTTPPVHVNVCGDFYCYTATESCATCPSDCGRCPKDDDKHDDDD